MGAKVSAKVGLAGEGAGTVGTRKGAFVMLHGQVGGKSGAEEGGVGAVRTRIMVFRF